MKNVAILFPGQGTQHVNMGADFYNQYSEYKTVIDNSSDDVKLAISGELDINQTRYAQQVLFANQVGILETIRSQFDTTGVSYGGFSLGEYSAYYASGVYDIELGQQIVESRASVMDEVASDYVTKVVIGLKLEELTAVIDELNQASNRPIYISNCNSQKQQLVNFAPADSDRLTTELKDAGARRLLDLNISGPFHTPIYNQASTTFVSKIDPEQLNAPMSSLYLNIDGSKYDKQSLLEIMEAQMTHGVQWTKQIETMVADGIDTFVEVGSKSVLAGMIKKIDRKVTVITVETVADIEKLEEVWNRK